VKYAPTGLPYLLRRLSGLAVRVPSDAHFLADHITRHQRLTWSALSDGRQS